MISVAVLLCVATENLDLDSELNQLATPPMPTNMRPVRYIPTLPADEVWIECRQFEKRLITTNGNIMWTKILVPSMR
jgi:hypothetical protein